MHSSSQAVKQPRPSNNPRSLEDLVLGVVANNFSVFSPCFESEIFSDLQRQKLFHELPTNLPLQAISSIIPDGIFWKRSCYDHWNPAKFIFQYKNSWKNLYMEVFLQNFIQHAYPNNINLIQLKETIELVKEYVHTLHIEHLRAIEISGHEYSIKHVDLKPILLSLENLTELSIRARVKENGFMFTEHFFQLTDIDCSNIVKGLQKSNILSIFKIHQTQLDVQKLGTICSFFSSLPQLEHIEFTSCYISNDSINPLTDAITTCEFLRKLILTNNRIGPEGCNKLASVLTKTKLEVLDLRLNFVRDTGACALFSSIQTHSTLRTLILSGCRITSLTIQNLVTLIEKNRRLEELDMNCNELRDLMSSSIIEALKKNPTIRKLHLKMSGIPPEQKEAIDAVLASNYKRES